MGEDTDLVWLLVNGKSVEVQKGRSLMDVLRNDLHLKSVKDGCSEGACGTCTVLVDGSPRKSCVQKVENFAGCEILTVEGLSDFEKEAFVYAFGEVGAVQCGFCIPGMVLCGKALLDKNPTPSRVEIAAAIRNNICRCTGYKKIIDGIALAGDVLSKGVVPPKENFHRIDVAPKVLGYGEYVDDVEILGMVYAGAVRSEYPRARVLSIDVSGALDLEGVLAVYTADDIPGKRKVGHLKQDWDALISVGHCTHYLGDAICLVVAENSKILEEAKKLVRIEYEPLEPLENAQMALGLDAPSVHSGDTNNILSHEHLVRGDANQVIQSSAYQVTKHYETPWTEHAFLEPECAIAMPWEDGVFIYSSDQGTFDTRHETSILLGLPPEKVIVENKLVGGGFGGKEDVTVQHLAAMAAYLTKRVVKMKLSRSESILVHPKRHPFSIDLTTACDEHGYLTAMKAVIVADSGAYASLGGPVLQRACTHAAGPYNYQTIDIDGTAVYTNNPPAGAFRGFGVTQTCFATECNLNLLAELVGISPWEMRYRNAIRPGQILPNGQIADASTGLVETLEVVKEVYESSPFAGIACAMKNAGVGVGIPDTGRVKLVVEQGKVHIYSGASCIGQGLGTVLVEILSKTTGILPEHMVYHRPNTAKTPDSGTTSGSRQTLITGEACRRAGELLKSAMEGDLWSLEGQEFYGEFLAKTDKMGAQVEYPVSHIAYGYATQVCVLQEDGKIEKIVAAHDVGKAIHRKSVEGQIEGGVVMSLGYALTEQYPLMHCIPTGKYGTLGLLRADKVPEVESIIIEKPGIGEAYGAIGVGEITSIPTAPAVQGAYYKWNGVFQTVLPLMGTPYSRKK